MIIRLANDMTKEKVCVVDDLFAAWMSMVSAIVQGLFGNVIGGGGRGYVVGVHCIL